MQTITEFDRQFGTDEQCRKFIVAMRWPDGVVKCARCGSDRVFAAKTRPFNWVCKSGAQVRDRKTGEYDYQGWRIVPCGGHITMRRFQAYRDGLFCWAFRLKEVTALCDSLDAGIPIAELYTKPLYL